MNPQITKEDEKQFRKIADYLFKREYPSVSFMGLVNKFGNTQSTMKALAMLQSGNMIKLNKDKHVSLTSIQILDQHGKEIPNEMIDTYPTSETCFIWFKDYQSEDRKHCFDHLETIVKEKIPYVKDCPKCLNEWGSHRCLAHNQSLIFCEQCKQQSKKLRALVCNELTFEQMERLVIDEHKKDLRKRRGF